MTLAPVLVRLLAELPESDQLDFERLQQALLTVRFTGPVTYHYLNGIPHQINLGQPVKLAICRGDRGGGT